MSPVATRPRPAPARRRSDMLGLLAGGLGLVLAFAVLLPAIDAPPHVTAVTIDNPHGWSVDVDATNASGDGWVGIGNVAKSANVAFAEVLDQGPVWVFRFSYAGVDGGQLKVSRADLEGSGWEITVPDEFARRMRAAGLGPSAR